MLPPHSTALPVPLPGSNPYQMQLVAVQPVCPASAGLFTKLYTLQLVTFPAHCGLQEDRKVDLNVATSLAKKIQQVALWLLFSALMISM